MCSKALLKVGYACNNRCVFCHSEPFRRLHPDLTTKELKARILAVKTRGVEMVVFSGGEPTIRRDIVELVRFAGACGLQTGFATNGRRFVYPQFGRELYAHGFRYAYVSFHSPSSAAHKLSARTDSMPQVLGAIENLTALGVQVTVNTVVTKYNIDDLTAVVDILAARNPEKIKFSVLEPKGAALDDNALAPSLAASAEAIVSAIGYGRRKYPNLRFVCEGLPPCLLPGYFEGCNDDLNENGFILFQEAFEERFSPPDYANRLKPGACCDCAWLDSCPGIFEGYLALSPPPAIKPDIRPRANSFVYLKGAGGLPIPAATSACPVHESDARQIFVLEKGRLHVYRTPTEDFTEGEIAETLGLRQIYITMRGKHKGLHYGRDMAKLRVSSFCSGCGHEETCSRIYEKSAVDVFSGLEAILERHVRRLHGDVLEIGCGAVRFRLIIEARARSGDLRYVGIDPDLPRLRKARGVTLRQECIEDFEAPPASFDYVMILRSYNHIRRPSVAFPKIFRLLRPGGRLIVVDGISYGLVLSKKPGPADNGEFQHFRNHSSGQARRLLESFGFAAIREIPVRADQGSEWILILEKR